MLQNFKNIKDEDDGRKMLSSGKISGVIILPDNFEVTKEEKKA